MSALLTTAHWLTLALYPLTLAYAVISDARRMIIPNWASITIAAAFLPAALLGSVEWTAIAWHYGVGLGLFLAGLILFFRGLMGGGDLKLLAAAGVWIGWNDLWSYLFLVALLGGGLALAVLIAGKFQEKLPFLGSVPWIKQSGMATPFPYGIAIGLAAIFLFPRNPALPPSWAAVLGG